MKKILLLVILLLPTFAFSKKVINSGHQSPVKFLEHLDSEQSFFSLSEDGTLVIKKTNSQKISRRIFLTSYNVTDMVLSPKNNQLAIVETDNAALFMVSVWDWKKERKLYSIPLKEFPMTIGFTGAGSYLFVTSISSTPVRLFNARTGASTTYLKDNSKFVDYMYVGSSEKWAFLYSSSGTLDIRSLKTSKSRSLKTETDLTNINITPDKAYLIGQKGEEIYIINRNSGKVHDKKLIPNLNFYELNETTGEINCFIDNRYKKTIKILQIVGGNFFETKTKEIVIKSSIGTMSATMWSQASNLSDSDIDTIGRFIEETMK